LKRILVNSVKDNDAEEVNSNCGICRGM